MLCVFRLLSFFVVPTLFFHLLFIGFPLGGLVAARWFSPTRAGLERALWGLALLMVASGGLCLLSKRADALRAAFFDLRPWALLGQVVLFSALFLPFFAGYGLTEYVGYQVGRRGLRGRTRWVYGAYLFGAAAAYLAVHFGLPFLGVARLLVAAVALATLAAAVVGGRRRLLVAVAGLAGLAAIPGLEAGFLHLYKGSYGGHGEVTSTKGLAQRGPWELIHQRWGRYGLVELMAHKNKPQVAAFYNDVIHWNYTRPHGIPEQTLDAVPFYAVPAGGRVLILGAGGGRQVRFAAEQFSFREIVAVEIEPEVFRITRKRFPRRFDRVYEAEEVTPVCAEGRSYLERASGPFDLIFLPSVGGYPQMMLEPGSMLRTAEAYGRMREKLTEDGVLAVWYPAYLDPDRVLTRQYVRTFKHLGLATTWHENARSVLILASASAARAELPEPETRRFFAGRVGPFDRAAPAAAIPRRRRVEAGEHFTPITDERPFLAGNVRNILSLEAVKKVFAGLACGAVLLGGVILAVLRKSSGDAGRFPFAVAAVGGLLVGANFLVMEHALVVALFERSYIYYEALVQAAVLFLVATGAGSLLLGRRRRVACLLTGGASVVLLAAGAADAPKAALLASLPAAVGVGAFFPALFEAAEGRRLVVFAMDAIGAAMGSLGAFFVPVLLGLDRLFLLAGLLGLVTATVVATLSRAPLRASARGRDQASDKPTGPPLARAPGD